MARTLMSAPPTGRVGRYPKHTFQVNAYPFQAQPFMIAPVLPNETLKSLKFESRVITSPIKNSIIGWKKEYYFFYVRATDLLSDSIRDMFVDPANVDLGATLGIAANDRFMYTSKGGIDYVNRCLRSVWKHYFADWDDVYEDFDSADRAGVPYVQVRDRFWLDSITDGDLMPDGDDTSTATSAEQLATMMAMYDQLRAMGIANMTYEDYLRSYGISVPGPQEHKPELLCRLSDFQYPSNTIDPADGSPTSAVSWVFNNTVRDEKFFKEPGFIFGVSITRPKLYFGGLAGNLSAYLGRAWDWLPNYLNESNPTPMPFTSLKHFTGDTGPLGDRTSATDDYWVDMRDLFLHGDQWLSAIPFNPAPANEGDFNSIALPPGDNAQLYKYPNDAMVKSLFVGNVGTVNEDGYVSMSISGKQLDYTVGNIASE